MMWGAKLEARLPSRRAMGVMLDFSAGFEPDEARLKSTIEQWGYSVAEGTLNISSSTHTTRWNFVMVAMVSQPVTGSLFELSRLLRQMEGISGLQISHARN
jgi:putative Mg2+ transporter-C (MgtC) family protein